MKISVRSISKKFRRAGLAFTEVAKEFEVNEKTLAILKSEPQLVVEEVKEVKESKEGKK